MITTDELGRFWRCDDDGLPVSGPYDTEEEAEASEPADEEEQD